MATEQYANLAATTLASAYTAADGHIHVASASGFPTVGNFRVRLGDAGAATVTLFKVTAVSGTEFTGVAEGTDSSIASGQAVTQVLTSGFLDAKRVDDHGAGTYANLPAAAKAGRVFLPNNGIYLYRDTGAAWQAWGPMFPLTAPPAVSTLTWDNQNAATAVETRGGIYLSAPASNGFSVLYQSAPAPPWTFTVGFIPNIANDADARVGLALRESGTGEIIEYAYSWGSTLVKLAINKFNSTTSWNSNVTNLNFIDSMVKQGIIFMRLSDDGANYRKCYISSDNITFTELRSDSRTDFCTGDQFGILSLPGSTCTVSMWVLHWETSTSTTTSTTTTTTTTT